MKWTNVFMKRNLWTQKHEQIDSLLRVPNSAEIKENNDVKLTYIYIYRTQTWK